MKRDFSSWLLGVIIIGVAALIVVAFVRYFRYRTIIVEELSKKDEIVEKFGDALAKPPTEDLDQTNSAPAAEGLASPSSPTRGTKGEGTSREVTEGAFQIRKSYSEHGRQAIVKSAGDAKAYKNAGTRFTENEPNWDNPFPLSYQGLRKVFLYPVSYTHLTLPTIYSV